MRTQRDLRPIEDEPSATCASGHFEIRLSPCWVLSLGRSGRTAVPDGAGRARTGSPQRRDMNEQPKHGLHAGATALPSAESLAQHFEAAWKLVRAGEEGPKIELFLLAVEEVERP